MRRELARVGARNAYDERDELRHCAGPLYNAQVQREITVIVNAKAHDVYDVQRSQKVCVRFGDRGRARCFLRRGGMVEDERVTALDLHGE